MNLSLQSTLTLYRLSIQRDRKHYIVEEPISGEFFEMPKICVDAIEMMEKGDRLGEIEVLLQKKYPKEDVDIVEFAEQLIDLGLVEAVDGEKVESGKKKAVQRGFLWISPQLGQCLFNKLSNKLYRLIFVTNVVLLVANPALIPNYTDIFIWDSMILSVFCYMLISLVLIVIHEFGHILAIRAYDLPAKLGISNRLLFIVFEADLTSAWKLPSKQRNVLYFAGMAVEQSVLLITLLLKLLLPTGALIFQGILAIVIFDIFIKTLYQCCFYMKTDVYYIIENITGCYNLMENSKQTLRKWLPFIKYDSTTEVFHGETTIIRLYTVLYVSGIVLTCSLFAIYFIPQVVYAYSHTLPYLANPGWNGHFWDATILLAQTIIVIGLLLFSLIKKRANT